MRPTFKIKSVMIVGSSCGIVILVICLNILGDGVRDALDPRLKGITH